MEIKKAFLVLVDISGYTQFIRNHKASLIHAERIITELLECDICVCDACQKVDQLKLKAIVHHGEVAVKKIRGFEELGGEDVILAHRLLKNSIKQLLKGPSIFRIARHRNTLLLQNPTGQG
jgi:hypothetical protein